MNITLLLPEGSSTHGNPSLLCSPPRWYDYIIFFGANYFAHAFTVVTEPGQDTIPTAIVALLALLFPVSGVTRAVRAIRSRAIFEKDTVKRAARAGALVMVVENGYGDPNYYFDWSTTPPLRYARDDRKQRSKLREPQPWWTKPSKPHRSSSRIAGVRQLNPGYRLALVPRDAPLGELDMNRSTNFSSEVIPSTYNFPKLMFSLGQAIWASVTIYRARGDQVQQYGYAAFGLTVVPYAIMSVANALGNLLTPEYANLTLIYTPVLVEGVRGLEDSHNALKVDLMSGRKAHSAQPRGNKSLFQTSGFMALILGLTPLIVVGALSGFKAEASSPLERGFALTWLLCSVVFGPILELLCRRIMGQLLYYQWKEGQRLGFQWEPKHAFWISLVLVLASPAIGGMIVVGLQLQSFGVCTLLS